MIVRTNAISLNGQNSLKAATEKSGKAMEKLASGLRITSAKDDAAGQSIANKMDSQINGLSQARKNANDGLSLTQSAESSLSSINDNLLRVRDLTVQALNETISGEDRNSIESEIDSLFDEVERIQNDSEFNGQRYLLKDQNIRLQVGANNKEEINIEFKSIGVRSLGLSGLFAEPPVGKLLPISNNLDNRKRVFPDDAEDISGLSINVSNIDQLQNSLQASDGSKPTFSVQQFDAFVDDNNNAFFAVFVRSPNEETSANLSNEGIEVSAGGGKHFYFPIDPDDVVFTSASFGSKLANFNFDALQLDLAVLGQTETKGPLERIDNALAKVDQQRSYLGAIQNRLNGATEALISNSTNLESARSRIVDVDYAEAVGELTKNQIIQEASTSLLAQANQIPSAVLSLLEG